MGDHGFGVLALLCSGCVFEACELIFLVKFSLGANLKIYSASLTVEMIEMQILSAPSIVLGMGYLYM